MIPPNGWKQVKEVYGDFKYLELSKGNVDIDDTWERDNLVTLRDVCKTGIDIRLHRLVAPVFERCLRAAMAAAPKYRIRLLGAFSPRHQRHDPALPLSLHSWGCAFDINWDKNPMGSKLVTDLPPEFVKVFTDAGWEWGGAWKSIKDAMHFQFARGV